MRGRLSPRLSGKREYSLPEIGRLSVGDRATKQKGNRTIEFPVGLDYFRLRTDDEKVRKAWLETYGEKPSNLRVSFFSDDLSKVCNQYLELRYGRVKFAWGDGETFHVWNPQTRESEIRVLPSADALDQTMRDIREEALSFAKTKREERLVGEWSQVLNLKVWLPDFPILGEFRLTTKGESSSIQNVINGFDLIQEQVGTVVQFPFDLSVKLHKADTMSRSQYPVIDLKPMISKESIQAISESKRDLLSEINHARGSLRVISDADVKMIAEGEDYMTAHIEPQGVEPGSPKKEIEEMAAEEVNWIDAEVKGKRNPEVDPSEMNRVAMLEPGEMTLSDGLKYLRLSNSINDLSQRYKAAPQLHREQSFFRGYWRVAIDLAKDNPEYLAWIDSNAKQYGISDQDWFLDLRS